MLRLGCGGLSASATSRCAARRSVLAGRAGLNLERLEDRVTPATVTWTGAAGTAFWHDTSNWLDDANVVRPPAAGDDVVIPDVGQVGPDVTVVFDSGTAAVRSVTSAENFTLSGGTVTVTGGWTWPRRWP